MTDAPGPGNYSDQTNTFGKAVMGGHMGSKVIEKVSSNPGPGQYENNDMMTKTSAQQVAFSQAERTDYWAD